MQNNFKNRLLSVLISTAFAGVLAGPLTVMAAESQAPTVAQTQPAPAADQSLAVVQVQPAPVAATPPTQGRPSFAASPSSLAATREIQEISERIAVLEAQRKEAESRYQLTLKNKEIEKLGGSDVRSGPAADMSDIVPTVRDIEGFDGKYRARLAYSQGITAIVKEGDKLQGGYVVTQITANSVTLKKGKDVQVLTFGYEPPPNINSSAFSGAPGMMPSMPMPGMPNGVSVNR